ncbi:MAG: hypothetical protein WKG32_04995 [Gemmatimonadaceae bacterium]
MGFVRVVNMIPASLSGETNQDSEPNLAVNPERPTDIVGTAFTPAPAGGALAPIYVSTDGGQTWTLRNVVPGGSSTGDITVGFSTTGGVLYAGILRQNTARMQVLRTPTFTANTPMTVLLDRSQEDQPWLVAGSVVVNGRSVDRVYVGSRDAQSRPFVGAVAAATAAAPAGFRETPLGLRRGPFSLPPTRMAIHPDGTVYAAFMHCTRAFGDGNNMEFEVVVRRDDSWGDNVNAFAALAEPGQITPGVRASAANFARFNDTIGQERVGADLAIAVDPNDSSTVYLAFCDRSGGVSGTDWRLSVLLSNDRGNRWSVVHDIGPTAKNPALAVSAEGRVGLAYQEFTGGRWVTRLELTRDAWATAPETKVLHQAPANVPARSFFPYIGDYIRLLAVGNDFYGVFSGNNTPDLANFPNGVSYQRSANFVTRVLLNVDGITPVTPSIDPFFFHWSRVKPRETKQGITKDEADTPPKSIKSEIKELVESKPGVTKAEADTPPKSVKAEIKEVVESKPGLTKAELDLPRKHEFEHGPKGLGSGGLDAFTSLLLKLNQRLGVLEEQVVQGQAFIRPTERPDVGTLPDQADEEQ